MIEKTENIFNQNAFSTHTGLTALLIGFSIVLISIVLYYILSRLFLRFAKRSENQNIKEAWKKFKNPFLVLILLIDFIIIKELLTLDDKMYLYIRQFVKVFVIFCITWFLVRAINLTREMILRRFDMEQEDNLKARKVYTQFRVLERIIIFVVILIAIAIALMTFDGIKRIGISLFASAGMAGIIIGFAAQKMLGSILAGFQIALTQPIRIDDVVIVENEWGWIEEITLTYVVVRIWDKRRLIVPTTYFIEKPFQNWTRVSADILGTVYIYTDYHLPVDKLREAFMQILEESGLWDGITGVMQVTNATDRSLEIRALMSAVNSPTAWDLRVYVRERLIGFLQQNFPESLPRTRVEMIPPSLE
ncbi:MAG TPA: mechanosensitive ion channel domain-containing protein [Bacteroidales bacterium]|nr:mechanosensitive ion channel domain-containing protein [Bacteroidales bacterium]